MLFSKAAVTSYSRKLYNLHGVERTLPKYNSKYRLVPPWEDVIFYGFKFGLFFGSFANFVFIVCFGFYLYIFFYLLAFFVFGVNM